jgi:hypothetical protein
MTILPKGELAGQDNESKMNKAESKKGAYFFDYTAKTPGQPLVRIANVNRLLRCFRNDDAALETRTHMCYACSC